MKAGLAVILALLTGVLGGAGVAEGATGCTNGSLPGFRAYLPECRAYEMVSPSYKQGFSTPVVGASEDGSQVLVESDGSYLTSEGNEPEGTGLFGLTYRLMRTEAGWKPVPVDAPFSKFPKFEVIAVSPTFGSSLSFAGLPGQSSADVYIHPMGGPLTSVGPGAPPNAAERSLNFRGASDNLTHAIFIVASPNEGLEEDGLWPGDTTFGGRRPSLYEYSGTENAEPRLVGVSNKEPIEETAHREGKQHINEAANLISDCGTVLGSDSYPAGGDVYNAISASGATVFFTARECGGEPPTNELYARINGEKTVAVSEPTLATASWECTGSCATTERTPGDRKPGVFAGASLDGSRVFFTTQQSLVNGDENGKGSGVDLYEAEIKEGIVTRLTQISRGGEGDATPGSDAEVLGVARVSEDGSHVYFVAKGVLTAANGEGKAPLMGAPNLYVYSRICPGSETDCRSPEERTSFVATLSAVGDQRDWGSADVRPVQATPDGRFLVFQSTADLTPDQEERIEAGQVFEYDAQTERLVRVSRGQDGYNEDGNSSDQAAAIPVQIEEVNRPSTPLRTRFDALAMSADGSRVFFSSAAALTPLALNSVVVGEEKGRPLYAINVYEYHDGQIGLISDGHDVTTENGHTTTELIGTDESGSDVFFTSGDRLVPQDTDAQVDIYDARIDGGFASPVEPSQCSPGACKGPAGEVPSLLAPSSTSVPAEAVGAPVGPTPPGKQKVVKKKPKKLKRSPSKHNKRNAKKTRAGRK